jgi:predicted oxidoreductase (fatty acid repression mutant protein)
MLMSFLQIKLLEAQIASYRKPDNGRDKHSELRKSTESVIIYKLKKKINHLQEEYAQLDDRFKQVGS